MALLGFVVVAAGFVLLRALAGVDLAATLRAVSRPGPWVAVALAPFVVSTAFDAAGMTLLMRALGRTVPFGRMLAIRIATEALHLTAPAGFLVADSATPCCSRRGRAFRCARAPCSRWRASGS